MEEFLKAGLHVVENGKSRKYSNLVMLFPEDIQWSLQQSPDHYTIARIVTDFVSGLTDRHAISLYKKIKGFAV
jgi:dGTPase